MRRREDDLTAWQDDPVVRALTGPPAADELAGAEPVLAAYRASVSARPARHGRLARRIGGTGVAAIVAVAALSGAAAAAYVRVLPDAVQQAFHDIFNPLETIGVPSPPKPLESKTKLAGSKKRTGNEASRPAVHGKLTGPPPGQLFVPPAASPAATVAATAAPSASAQPSASASAPASPSPSPSAAPQTMAAITVASRYVGYNRSFSVHGQIKVDGNPSANRNVTLWEKRYEDSQWAKVGSTMQTDSQGRVTFTSPGLTENTKIRLTTAGGRVTSRTIAMVMLPRVAVSIAADPDGTDDDVTVSTTGAQQNDVVYLDRKDGDSWTALKSARLGPKGHARFVVPMPATGSQLYRVRVKYTSMHGTGIRNFTLSA